MLLLPVAIGLFAVFTLGLSLIVATANTFFRDCGHLVSVVLAGLVFRNADPLIRSRHFRGHSSGGFVSTRRIYFIELFHEVLYAGHWPRISLVAAAALIAAASLGIGYAIFKSHEDKMVFRL